MSYFREELIAILLKELGGSITITHNELERVSGTIKTEFNHETHEWTFKFKELPNGIIRKRNS